MNNKFKSKIMKKKIGLILFAFCFQQALIASTNTSKIDQLVEAIKNNERDEVGKLIEEDKSLINGKNSAEISPIIEAASDGCNKAVDMVALLVENGAYIEQKDKYEETALHKAIIFNNMGTLKFLIEKNANSNAKNNDGDSPVHTAVKYENLEALKFLIEKNADGNAKNNDGNSPVHTAVKCKNIEALKLLLNNKANINVKNNDGDTPVHTAVECKNIEALKLLLNNKANINVKNNDGDTPLDLASNDKSQEEIVKLLKQNGAQTTGIVKKMCGTGLDCRSILILSAISGIYVFCVLCINGLVNMVLTNEGPETALRKIPCLSLMPLFEKIFLGKSVSSWDAWENYYNAKKQKIAGGGAS